MKTKWKESGNIVGKTFENLHSVGIPQSELIVKTFAESSELPSFPYKTISLQHFKTQYGGNREVTIHRDSYGKKRK